MLGLSAGLNYREQSQFHTSADYLSYLFGGIKGLIARGTINPEFKQNFYRASGIVKAHYAQNNVYVSMNTFFRNKRDVESVKRLNAFYVDLDCYKLGLDKNFVLSTLEDDYFGWEIPHPTFIIDSGRGLYLIWKLRNEDRKALPRWTIVQEWFCEKLKPLGADPACKDAARILRVPFSYNAKSHTEVTIRAFNDLTYSIYDIMKEYDIKTVAGRKDQAAEVYPYNSATKRQRQYASIIATKLGITLPDFNCFQTTWDWIKKNRVRPRREDEEKAEKTNVVYFRAKKSKNIADILQGYCHDIETLFTLREGEDCKRELGLFLYRLFQYEMTHDKKIALDKTLSLNKRLSRPFKESYVKRATYSAEKKIDAGQTYHYRKSTIIATLDITPEEMRQLSFLVTGSNRQRKKENNRKAYLARLKETGKSPKAEEIASRRAKIIKMQESGKTAKEIREALNIGRATYYRDIAAISAGCVVASVKEAAKAVISTAKDVFVDQSTKVSHETFSNAGKNRGERDVSCGVSKIQPINYKGAALPLRTAATGNILQRIQLRWCLDSGDKESARTIWDAG